MYLWKHERKNTFVSNFYKAENEHVLAKGVGLSF